MPSTVVAVLATNNRYRKTNTNKIIITHNTVSNVPAMKPPCVKTSNMTKIIINQTISEFIVILNIYIISENDNFIIHYILLTFSFILDALINNDFIINNFMIGEFMIILHMVMLRVVILHTDVLHTDVLHTVIFQSMFLFEIKQYYCLKYYSISFITTYSSRAFVNIYSSLTFKNYYSDMAD